MTIVADDFRLHLQALLLDVGVVPTEGEWSHIAERYPRCPGESLWDVREYARPSGRGAREYRVVRGTGVLYVYCSVERERATAVRMALNELETQRTLRGIQA